jgi:hypothetical protein
LEHPDPAGAALPGEDRRKLFFDAFTLRRRIELFASLPLDKLSGLPCGAPRRNRCRRFDS